MKNGKIIFSVLSVGIIAIDLSFLFILHNDNANAFIVYLVAFCNLVYVADIFVCLYRNRAKALEGATKAINDKAKKLYLCGFSIDKYAANATFYRFSQWADGNFSHVVSVIAMFLLKGNKTARLCKGKCYSQQREAQNYYWVEFYIKKRQYVLDLMLKFKPISSEVYNKAMGTVADWSISYRDFWDIGATYQIYMAMQEPNTSYVLDLLTKLYWNAEDGKGFAKGIHDFEIPKGYHMQPVSLPNGRIVEADTLKNFVEDPSLIF